METKSRYEVISELEKQKRELIRERDSMADEVEKKVQEIKKLERRKEDLAVQVKDFKMSQEIKLAKLGKEQQEFDFKIENTKTILDRQTEDATADLEYFKGNVDKKKETINELIKGVDDSLARFNALQKSSSA